MSRTQPRAAASRTSLLAACGGGAALELALTAPVLFMFLLGIVESGRALWTYNALTYSVAEAARCASDNHAACGSAAQIQAFAAARSGGDFDAAIFSAIAASCGNRVSASYPMVLSIPFMSLSVTLTAQACFPS